MATVTQRIREIPKIPSAKQPKGGYLPPKTLVAQTFNDGITLNIESLHPVTVGLVVDYLFRATIPGNTSRKAFEISLIGAELGKLTKQSEILLAQIKGLDDVSIIAAAKLASYDQFYRVGYSPYPDPAVMVNPNQYDIENIRTLVKRTKTFFDKVGPITVDGFTFIGDSEKKSGFTKTITAGDGDLLTADGLWDLKVSKKSPTSLHTLQILMYWLMGLRSFNANGAPLYDGNFQNIKQIGIFNPRLNTSYTIETSNILEQTIQTVYKNVIN